ncbi:MAG TPA: substrate-binding domain-containing protein [Kutzneria sp.]|nr:substrate-binding domain-containing protein [Kutzneria sp.]
MVTVCSRCCHGGGPGPRSADPGGPEHHRLRRHVPPGRWASPPLTTARQPFAEMGRAAADALLRLAAGATLNRARVELATTVIVRESAAPPSVR